MYWLADLTRPVATKAEETNRPPSSKLIGNRHVAKAMIMATLRVSNQPALDPIAAVTGTGSHDPSPRTAAQAMEATNPDGFLLSTPEVLRAMIVLILTMGVFSPISPGNRSRWDLLLLLPD